MRNVVRRLVLAVAVHQAIRLEEDGLDVLILLLAVGVSLRPTSGSRRSFAICRLAAGDRLVACCGIREAVERRARSRQQAACLILELDTGLRTLRLVVGKIVERLEVRREARRGSARSWSCPAP